MKFSDWAREKDLILEGDENLGFSSIDKFKTNDVDAPSDHENLKSELMKIAFSKYPEDTVDFFEMLSLKDNEVHGLFKRLNGLTKIPDVNTPPTEVIVPSSADAGTGGIED